MKPKKRVTVSLDSDLHARGIQRAVYERRNFSNWVETLIERDLALAEVEAVSGDGWHSTAEISTKSRR